MKKSQFFLAPRNRENIVECGLFVSDKRNPKFVDDPGCRLLGHLYVPFSSNKRNCETLIEETLIFQETSLEFIAEDIYSGLMYSDFFDLQKD